MSLTVNTNIVNDADGYLLDASNVKVGEMEGQRVMLDVYIQGAEQEVAGKEPIPAKETSLPASGPLAANTMYYLGQISDAISVSFPSSANLGDFLFFSYSTGSTVPTVTVTLTHSIGLEQADWSKENAVYTCMAQWDGTRWVFAYSIL